MKGGAMSKKGVEYKILYMDEDGNFINTARKYVRERNIGEFTLEVEKEPLKSEELEILRELQEALPSNIDMPLHGPQLVIKAELPKIKKHAKAVAACKCRCKCGRSRSCAGAGGGTGGGVSEMKEPLVRMEPK
jgi:hypothetical protein